MTTRLRKCILKCHDITLHNKKNAFIHAYVKGHNDLTYHKS